MQKNNFFKKIGLCALTLSLTLFTSCVKQKGKPAEIAYQDFTQDLQKLTTKRLEVSDLKELKKVHGRFFDVWFSEIMDYSRYKGFSDQEIAQTFGQWLQINKPVFQVLQAHYQKNTQWQQDFSNQWGTLQALLPKTPTPKLYGYFSQFSNYNTFVDTTENGTLLLGFSKEMFLNDTFPLYAMLEVPGFYNRYNSPEQIPTLLIWNYLKSHYESKHKINSMLEQAIFDGKIWAILMEITDAAEPYQLLGYTPEEWARLEKDQGQMWRHYIEEKVLYSKNFNQYRRYFVYGDKTFGPNIPADCPPMIGSFTGFKIVKRYMEEMDVTWEDVFNETDAQKMLRLSGYNPAR
jgi:hypothetical protein